MHIDLSSEGASRPARQVAAARAAAEAEAEAEDEAAAAAEGADAEGGAAVAPEGPAADGEELAGPAQPQVCRTNASKSVDDQTKIFPVVIHRHGSSAWLSTGRRAQMSNVADECMLTKEGGVTPQCQIF